MTDPSGYPGTSSEPYGSPGQYSTGGNAGYNASSAPGSYPAGQYQPGYQPGYQQPNFQQPGYQQNGQYPPPQPAPYPTPGFPPAGAYGQPGYGAPAGALRPGMVTAAAVLAFIWGGLGILFGLIGIAAGSVLNSASDVVCNDRSITADTAAACNSVSGWGTFLIVVTIGAILVAGLMIWGGVVALNGKNGQILVIACAAYAVLAIISVIASSFGFSYLLGFVIPILIAVFMLNTQSRAWFRARGGKTF
jgi:hypothetical protein